MCALRARNLGVAWENPGCELIPTRGEPSGEELRVPFVRTTYRPPPSSSGARVAGGSSTSSGPAPARSRAVRGRLRDLVDSGPAGSVGVVVGSVGASLLAVGLAWSSPQPMLGMVLLAVALPVCAIIVWWSIVPRHVAVRGARVVTTDDDRGWLVVRRPLGRVVLDGSRFGVLDAQRALADRVVAVHVSGRAEQDEILRLLDRVVALDRLEHGASGGSEAGGRSRFTPEQRSLLTRHVRDALVRDVELLESRSPGLPARGSYPVRPAPAGVVP